LALKAELKTLDIFECAKAGDIDGLKNCLKSGININSRDRDLVTPMVWAAYHGRIDAVLYLISAKADINARGRDGITAPMRAVEINNTEMVKLLISVRAAFIMFDNYRGTAFSRAVNEPKNTIVFDLLKKTGAKL